VSRRVSAWAPAVAWAAVIFSMSTDVWSSDHTASILRPLVSFFYPSISDEAFAVVHFAVRKLAHLTEYGVFALLLDRGFRLGSSIAPSRAPLAALVVAALYSLSDEAHQSFVASRGASLEDSAIDTVGAAIVATLLALLRRNRA